MKPILITILMLVAGMTIFAQSADMSLYEERLARADITFAESRSVLESVRNARITGIGEFYHNTLKLLLLRTPNISTAGERTAANAALRIVIQALAEDRLTAAAPELWQAVLAYDVNRAHNDGSVMQDALIALGQVDGRDFIPHIAQRLFDLNTQAPTDAETRRRWQRAATGCINALETFRDPRGFVPVFFVTQGWYDRTVQNLASQALLAITDDPGEIISEIIRDPTNIPPIKLAAWREMLRTGAPDESKAQTASVALAVSWLYATNNPAYQRSLSEMRISAITTIRQVGAADDTVYTNLERTYKTAFAGTAPNYDEVQQTLATLSALASERSVDLLYGFLQELHGRRRNGPWGQREQRVFPWLISGIGDTRTQSEEVRLLLINIGNTPEYTGAEQRAARNALNRIIAQ